MLRYIGKRILIAIPTFLGITILVYVLSFDGSWNSVGNDL